MSKEYYLSGGITDDLSNLTLDDAPFLKRLLEQFRGKRLEIRISEFYEQRSSQQNRYLWGVVIPLIVGFHKETQGEVTTPDEVYAFLLTSIAGYKVISKEIFGEVVLVVQGKSTSKMNTKEFMAFTDEVRTHFDKKGLEIPPPKNNNFLNDYL